MKAVLLATGLARTPDSNGTRSAARHRPPTIRPLIDLAIESFAQAGVGEVGVVLHDNQGLLQRYLEDSSRYGVGVYTMRNDSGARGRAASVLAARIFVGGEPFVLALEAGHLNPGRLQDLSRLAWAPCALLAHRFRSRHGALGSHARLWLDAHGRVERAGLELERWNALAEEVYLFQPDVFRVISALLQAPDSHCSIVQLVCHFIRSGQLPQACLPEAGRSDLSWMVGGGRCSLPVLSVPFSPERISV